MLEVISILVIQKILIQFLDASFGYMVYKSGFGGQSVLRIAYIFRHLISLTNTVYSNTIDTGIFIKYISDILPT